MEYSMQERCELTTLSWRAYCNVMICIPTLSLLVCLGLPFVLDGHLAIGSSTHCHSREFMPSISAATGDLTPEKYVWRVGVALFVGQRYIDGFLQYIFYSNNLRTPWLNGLKITALYLEYLFLLILTYVSSRDNLVLHETGFIGYQVANMVHTYTAIYMYTLFVSGKWNAHTRWTWRWMTVLGVANTVLFVSAILAFVYHRATCADYAYSIFGVFEWLMVFTNVAFHYSTIWILGDMQIQLSLPPGVANSHGNNNNKRK